jgi:uncharacterized membrane protein YkvA (DUF1232 family)
MNLREWARALKRDVVAIWLAARDPRTPWYAKALAVCVAAYALSPIDLIPDFIPVLGYLDEVIILPLGIWLVARMIPPRLMAEYRRKAATIVEQPRGKIAAALFILIWVALAALAGWLAYDAFSS